ncbi:MAG: hypothetical protein L3J35_05920 [Bacteroidales bacterium]|nr:hypothetical protein [Bacteroidales bacterium]
MKNFTIKASIVIVILTKIESLWSLFNLTINNQEMEIIQIDGQTYWIFQAISAIGIFLLAYFLIYKIEKLKTELKITKIIYDIRNRNLFKSDLDSLDFANEEQRREFINKKYKNYLELECKDVENLATNILDEKPSKIKKLVQTIYEGKTIK